MRTFLAEKATILGARGLTVDKFQEFVNRDLLPSSRRIPTTSPSLTGH